MFFEWLLGFIPLWAYLVVVIIILVLTYQIWLPFWLVTPKWLKTLIISVMAIISAFIAGRYKGASTERDEQKNRDTNAINTRSEVNKNISNLDGDSVDKRLDKWMRD